MKWNKPFGMMVAQITTHAATAKTTLVVVTKGVLHPTAASATPSRGYGNHRKEKEQNPPICLL